MLFPSWARGQQSTGCTAASAAGGAARGGWTVGRGAGCSPNPDGTRGDGCHRTNRVCVSHKLLELLGGLWTVWMGKRGAELLARSHSPSSFRDGLTGPNSGGCQEDESRRRGEGMTRGDSSLGPQSFRTYRAQLPLRTTSSYGGSHFTESHLCIHADSTVKPSVSSSQLCFAGFPKLDCSDCCKIPLISELMYCWPVYPAVHGSCSLV